MYILPILNSFSSADQLGSTPVEAEFFMKSFLSRYPCVARFQALCIDICRQQGYVETLCKRRRAFPAINSKEVSLIHYLASN